MTPSPEARAFSEMEVVYDQLAAAIDRAGPDHEALFLTRLVMVMAHRAGSSLDVAACIAAASHDEERRQATAS